MQNVTVTRQIPRWKEHATGELFARQLTQGDAVEWEANYLLPQLLGAPEHITKRLNAPVDSPVEFSI